MTHEELLHKIIISGDTSVEFALIAVLELHKPVPSYLFDDLVCSHCSSEEDRIEILYPCATIKAIKKELV